MFMFRVFFVFFFKQKTAYEMRISDWSSDVCSSDLWRAPHHSRRRLYAEGRRGMTYRRSVSRKLARGLALVGLVGALLLLAAVVFFYSLTFEDRKSVV